MCKSGSARASRAGDRALAIANFFKEGCGEAPQSAREGVCAPQNLLRRVKNPAALLAANDFFTSPYPRGRGRGHFHMTAGADFMFECDDDRVSLACEKALETAQQVLVNLAGKLSPLFGQIFQPRIQRF